MAWSKTSKVWAASVGGGLLAAAGGLLVVTGVGAGAGAVLITSGLAAIGGLVGGGMLAGIGVLAAGSATAAAISAAIANAAIEDPELRKLAEKLMLANQIYETANRKTQKQKEEIEDLNRIIGEMLRTKTAHQEEIERLRERLAVLIDRLQRGV